MTRAPMTVCATLKLPIGSAMEERIAHPVDDFAHVPQWQWDRALNRILRMAAGFEGQNANGDQFNFEQGKIDGIIQ
jgi:hypothetical protein